jgi:hypothetical protein
MLLQRSAGIQPSQVEKVIFRTCQLSLRLSEAKISLPYIQKNRTRIMRMRADLIESIRVNPLNQCHPRSILNHCRNMYGRKAKISLCLCSCVLSAVTACFHFNKPKRYNKPNTHPLPSGAGSSAVCVNDGSGGVFVTEAGGGVVVWVAAGGREEAGSGVTVARPSPLVSGRKGSAVGKSA